MKLLLKETKNSIQIRYDLVKSTEEILLAYYLTKQSFSNKTNISNNIRYEFLLWLTGTKDIDSALKRSKPKEKSLFIVFDNENLVNKTKLTKKAAPLDLEKISLSRI